MALNKEIMTLFYFMLSFLNICIDAYKPVVLLHGILSSGPSMLPVQEQIELVS